MCMKKTSRRLATHSVDKSEGSPFVSTGFHGNKLKIWTERSTTLTLLKIATIPSITGQRMKKKKKSERVLGVWVCYTSALCSWFLLPRAGARRWTARLSVMKVLGSLHKFRDVMKQHKKHNEAARQHNSGQSVDCEFNSALMFPRRLWSVFN